MTDLGQQEGTPQYFGQPPMVTQPYGSQPMMYAPQQVVYPPPQQPPISYSPQVSYVSPYVQNDPQVFIQAPEGIGHQVMSDVPLKNFSGHSFVEEERATYVHSEFDEEKPQGFPHQHYDTHHTLPSVITCSDVVNWFKEGWHMYAENWVPYTIVAFILVVFLGGSLLVDDEGPGWAYTLFNVGGILTFPLYYGFFTAGAQVHKQKERLLRERGHGTDCLVKVTPLFTDFFRGYFLFFPLLGYSIVLTLIIGVGFVLLIIPGIYLSVTLSFVPFVYIEYHRQSAYEATQQETVTLGWYECMAHSRRIIHQHFWEVLLFLILSFVIVLLGSITVIGSVIVIPVTSLAMVPAFRDLFGFQMNRAPDDKCYCCC